MRSATTLKRFGLCACLAASATLLFAALASAATPATWRILSQSNSTTPPDSSYRLLLELSNVGDEAADGEHGDPIVFTASLPDGMSAESITVPAGINGIESVDWSNPFLGWQCSGDGPGPAPSIAGAHNLSCSIPKTFSGHSFSLGLPAHPTIGVHVDDDATGTLVSHFTLSGAGAAADSTAEVTRIAAEPSPGIDAYDVALSGSDGKAFTQAAAHPHSYTTTIDYNTRHNPRLPPAAGPATQDGYPVEPTRDVVAELPPGLIGNLSSFDRCSGSQISLPTANCSIASQIGVIRLPLNFGGAHLFGPIPVYNMVPPPGMVAMFSFNITGVITNLQVSVRSDSDYGLSILTSAISQGLDINGFKLTTWGTPAEAAHDPERACPGQILQEDIGFGTSCTSDEPEVPYLRMPSSCTAAGTGLPFPIAIDTWAHPAAFLSDGKSPNYADPAWHRATVENHDSPGYPFPEVEDGVRQWGEAKGVDGCSEVPFEPQASITPTIRQADSPSGLEVEFKFPQECWGEGAGEAICQSDMRKSVVTLPHGITINPASAGGRAACSPEQVGVRTPLGSAPIHFDAAPANCPDAAKIGSAELTTPLLSLHDSEGHPVLDAQGQLVPTPLKGSVYLARQTDNPFKSQLALYLVIEDAETGLIIKQAGHVSANPKTGQLTTVFDETPQQPIEALRFSLFGGPRAALRTPPRCGTYTAQTTLSPWSGGAAVALPSSFQITEGPGGSACPSGGFNPTFSAGTQSPLAGSYSPLNLRLTRGDGSEEIVGLSATQPKGLVGKPAGVPYCPDSALASLPLDANGEALLGSGNDEIAAPRCPVASRIGTVIVGAGAGPNPFYATTGKAYLAGPYKGAPLSLAAVAPAVAGPFDLGTVVVRNALRIDPESGRVTAVSDPLPTMLHGIALDLRDIRVSLDRPNFTLNPTSCDEMAIEATIASAAGQSAQRSSRFQVAGCQRLAFKPKLSLRLAGKTKRGGHPALRAALTMPLGGTNIASAQVALPRSEFLDQAHIGTVCTRVQFAANQCPAKSIYGHARATSPLIDYAVKGPVYLRSSSHKLPDLVMALRGPAYQPVAVDAVARIDSIDGGIRSTFEAVPDLPLSKVVLSMKGGRKGLLQNSTNICRGRHLAAAAFEAQNGARKDFAVPLKAACGRGDEGKKHGRRGH